MVNFHISGTKWASPGTRDTVGQFWDDPGHSGTVGKPSVSSNESGMLAQAKAKSMTVKVKAYHHWMALAAK